MKVLTKEQEEAHYQAALKAGAKGGLIWTGVALAGCAVAHRYVPSFKKWTLPLKAFIVTSVGTAGVVIVGEKGSREYEMSQWGELPPDDRTDYSNLSFSQATLRWAIENKYKIVVGAWVLSMAGSLGFVWQNRYLSSSQKLVQARMYAQGLTLAVLLASATIGVNDSYDDKGRDVTIPDPANPGKTITIHEGKEHYPGENDWQIAVAQEEARLKAQGKMNEKGQLINKDGSVKQL
ncbi:Replication factor C, subunit RFC4 [Saitoella coloradoensis]